MSMTWEEPRARGALGTTVARVAALALLAIVGGVGGAGLAAWAVRGGDAEPATETAMMIRDSALSDTDAPIHTAALPAASPATPSPDDADRPDAIAEAAPAPKPRLAGSLLAPPQFATLARETADRPEATTGIEEVVALPAPGDPAAPVAIAETEADVAALEARMASEGAETGAAAETVSADAGTPAAIEPEPASPEEVVAAVSGESPAAGRAPNGKPMSPATAAKYVNLRAGPDNDAAVVAVVPAGGSILAETGCRLWCAVVHDGQSGYIFNSFIRRQAGS